MPDTREISALTTAESTSASDLFETALPNAMTETGYISRKVTLGTIANFLLSTLQFSSLNTTVKNIIGAINELAQGSGQSLDTLNDVDIDAQTLTDGQGIVYDATAQKWKNGAVSGGHTYSTTEQVVGTWIDDSPVYEKVFSFTANLNAGSWASTGQYMPNDAIRIIDVKGIANATGDTGTIPMIGYIKTDKELMVMNVRGQDLGSKPAIAVVQYIKSST